MARRESVARAVAIVSGQIEQKEEEVEHNLDMPMPPVPASIDAEDLAVLAREWTDARANAQKAVVVNHQDFQLPNSVAREVAQKVEVDPPNVFIAQKWTPPRFVPSETKLPPFEFYEEDGLVIKYENRGTVSRSFGPLLDDVRFGPERLELGMFVCDGCSNSTGEIIEIIDHPKLGRLYRQVWLDKVAGGHLYDGMFYPRSQLRLKTTGKREIPEDYLIPLTEQAKSAQSKKTRANSTAFPVERTFLSGWTDGDMASYRPRDRVMVNGGYCRVIRNDRTQRALVIGQTDQFGEPLHPTLNRSVACDACIAYYEDVDLKTPESQRFVEKDKRIDNERLNRYGRKFKLRDGTASSVGTSQSAHNEDQELLDGSDGVMEQPDPEPPTPNPPPSASNKNPPLEASQKSAKPKIPSPDYNVTLTAENFAALKTRINQLESKNSALETNALVLQLENTRNEAMMNHFIGTMQKIAHNFNHNADQQRIQTDRLEGLGNQFTSQGRELARCRTQMLLENKNDPERMSEKWKVAQSCAQGSHEILNTARLTASRQISGLVPMVWHLISPAHFSPSPKVKEVSSSKRSLTTAFNDQAPSEPPLKKIIKVAEPSWTNETMTTILKKHGMTENEATIVLGEGIPPGQELYLVLDDESEPGNSVEGAVLDKTPLSQRSSLPVPKVIKKKLTAVSKPVRPQFHHGVDSPTPPTAMRNTAPKPPAVPKETLAPKLSPKAVPKHVEHEEKPKSARVRSYMKEIDKGNPNGLNIDCKRPFNFNGDPVFRNEHFRLVYMPLCIAALGEDENSVCFQIVAAHFYFENVNLDDFADLPQDYKDRELRRHMDRSRSQFFGGNSHYPLPYAEEKVHHLYPFQRNVNADLALHTLLHAWVRSGDDNDPPDLSDDDLHDDDDDNYMTPPDYTPQAHPQRSKEPETTKEMTGSTTDPQSEPTGTERPSNNPVASGEWAPDSDHESEPEEDYEEEESGNESDTSNVNQHKEIVVIKRGKRLKLQNTSGAPLKCSKKAEKTVQFLVNNGFLPVQDSSASKLGGGGMNRILVYPSDDALLEGTPLPLELTINQFMDKLRKGKLTTYIPQSVVETICAQCLVGVKGKNALKAWQSCFSSLVQYILNTNPPRGYWRSQAGVMVVDRDLFKECLIRCRGYMKAVVRAKDMNPSKFTLKDVHEMHYLACRHFAFLFEIFKHLRKMSQQVKNPFPTPTSYKFYLDVIDNARRNINKRKHEAKQKVKIEEPAAGPSQAVNGSGANGSRQRSALAAELDCL